MGRGIKDKPEHPEPETQAAETAGELFCSAQGASGRIRERGHAGADGYYSPTKCPFPIA